MIKYAIITGINSIQIKILNCFYSVKMSDNKLYDAWMNRQGEK